MEIENDRLEQIEAYLGQPTKSDVEWLISEVKALRNDMDVAAIQMQEEMDRRLAWRERAIETQRLYEEVVAEVERLDEALEKMSHQYEDQVVVLKDSQYRAAVLEKKMEDNEKASYIAYEGVVRLQKAANDRAMRLQMAAKSMGSMAAPMNLNQDEVRGFRLACSAVYDIVVNGLSPHEWRRLATLDVRSQDTFRALAGGKIEVADTYVKHSLPTSEQVRAEERLS